MAQARLLDQADARPAPRLQQRGLDLARVLPRLVIEARRVASASAIGLHGRRRPGVGENFWQFRHFNYGEAAARIDWRRSARDEHLYVREREWESAHTVWLWVDRSPSMAYVSDLAEASKIERALVLGFAIADLLVRGGERVGLVGLTAPKASRAIVEQLAAAMLVDKREPVDLPPAQPLPPLTEAVLVGDFLAPTEDVVARIGQLASRGAKGHILMIADPIEETFPFTGRTELVEPEAGGRYVAGRIETIRATYVERLASHRQAIRREAERLGWSFFVHRTDQPASRALLALHPILMMGTDA